MKVDLEKVKIAVSPLTGEVYVGTTTRSGQKWRHKVDVTNEFIDCVIDKFLGSANKKTTEVTCGSAKWDITIEQTHK